MKRKRKRLRKKQFERLKREIAEQEAKDRSESENRQARIKVLWDLITSGKLVRKVTKSEDTATDLKTEIEEMFAQLQVPGKSGESKGAVRRFLRQEIPKSQVADEFVVLAELVHLQKLELEYQGQFHRHWELIEDSSLYFE